MSIFNHKIPWRAWWFLLIAVVALLPLIPQFSHAQDGASAPEQDAGQIFLPFISVEQGISAGQGEPDLTDHFADGHTHVGHAHDGDRFTAASNVWPPQPKGIDGVQLQVAATNRAYAANLQNANTVALLTQEVQDALGERYVYLGSESLVRKDDPENSELRNTYFSHSNNSTVDVIVDGENVVAINVIVPEAYQPPLGEAEVDAAIEIARTAMVADGYAAVADLEGFGILALPTDGISMFFENRVVYVSFHAHVDSPPEYLVWVDLTNETVTQSRED